MSISEITAQSINKAIDEFDELGREEFLSKYGFHQARRYYLVTNGLYYDSKALVGVAYGYQRPDIGPLAPADFSGGKDTVEKLLVNLGFTIVRSNQPRIILDESPLILVQNEETAGGLYDHWQDVTGERYHFPNQYRNRIIPDRPFVYYRGVRRAGGKQGSPEYFGTGRIGDVWRDDSIDEDAPKRGWKWFCSIDEYKPFTSPVPFKIDGEHIEHIPSNSWDVAVRNLPFSTYQRILKLAGLTAAASKETLAVLAFPDLSTVFPKELAHDDSLLVAHKPTKGSKRRTIKPRRSKHAVQIGNRGEEIALKYLQQHLSPKESITLRWVAAEGEKPGWDIEYVDLENELIGVEVKATIGSKFSHIELTANEFQSATIKRESFLLLLVADVRNQQPKIQLIKDPFGYIANNRIQATPTHWRLEFLSAAE